MRPHPRRARTDARSPRAWGTSDRNGMIGNQENLVWQYEWAGTQLVNKRVLVHPDEYDTPNRQLGTIILPPDPVSILNARPEPYYVEEQTMRLTQSGQVRIQMDGQIRLESNLQNTPAGVPLVFVPVDHSGFVPPPPPPPPPSIPGEAFQSQNYGNPPQFTIFGFRG